VLQTWSYRQKLTFDNTAQVSSFEDFKVLVMLDASRVDYSHFEVGGADLRFVDGVTETPIHHEIETWNPAGKSMIWVEVPRIDGGSDTDYLYMYYGNGGASASGASEQVWDSDFRGVWHLHDDFTDSTINVNDGQNNGSLDAIGVIGDCQEFAGSEFIRIPETASLKITGDLTLEAWVYKPVVDDMTIVSKHRGPGNLRSFRMGVDWTVVPNGPYVNLSETGSYDPAGGFLEHPGSEAVDTWQYVAGVHAGSTILLYVDGVLVAQNLASFPTLFDNSENVIIGAEQDGAANWFTGFIDEVRISASARSADWIAAQHQSMTDSFVNYGDVEQF
jgi:hypothetical protein